MSGEPDNGGLTAAKFVGAVVGFATNNGGLTAAKFVGAVVGFATIIWCVASMFSADSGTAGGRRTMKAPGKHGEKMYRDVFAKNPSKYFRDLRKK